ncbi:MAG: DMT family transporter [Thermoleophilia bacterium]|nr:DMT family transporter [Thermoleophilia bacterium]
MTAIGLALASAVLFGAMSVALRFALREGASAEAGALLTAVPALAVVLVFALAHGLHDVLSAWPFALAGLVAPGASQILFTLAVRDAGPSRTSVLVGTAPLFSVALALLFLDEPLVPALVGGAVLIVAGGALLVGERVRPETFRLVGYAFALAATVLFAVRDNLLRWLAVDTDVPASLAAVATLGSGTLLVAAFTMARGRLSFRGARTFALAGAFFGLSYVALFEAYYRGRVTVVSPLIATESLFGVLFSALVIRRAELIGKGLVAGAALIVAGGALIGAFR